MNIFEIYPNSKKEGDETEQIFKASIESQGYICKDSTLEDNKKHIDFWIYIDNTEYSVDIKKAKRKNRELDNIQYNDVCVEFKNRWYNGWLYGEQDLIAFELENKFLMVRRQALQILAEKLVSNYNKPILKTNIVQLNIAYHRDVNPKESFAYISIEDIKTNLFDTEGKKLWGLINKIK